MILLKKKTYRFISSTKKVNSFQHQCRPLYTSSYNLSLVLPSIWAPPYWPITKKKKKDDNDLAFLLDIPKTFSCFAKITRVPFVLNSPASTSFFIPFFEIFERTNLVRLVFQLAATWSQSQPLVFSMSWKKLL